MGSAQLANPKEIMSTKAPFFSVIVCTARMDYPFIHHRDWHVLDKIVENCQKQTFKDFELIIVDLLHSYRPHHFDNAGSKYNFRIIHIPDKSGIFKELKLPRISSSKNTGIIFSSGTHLVFSDDGQEWPEYALGNLFRLARRSLGASCKYYRDCGSGPVETDSRWAAYKISGTTQSIRIKASDMGYFGGTLSMVLARYMLACNGWDEMFDGTRQLEDGDMAQRLGACGCFVVLNGDVSVVEHKMDTWHHDERVFMPGVILKCNGSYYYPMLFKGGRKRRIANSVLPTDDDLVSYTYSKCRMLTNKGLCSVSNADCLGRWKWNSNPGNELYSGRNLGGGIDFLKRVYQDSRLIFDLSSLQKQVLKDGIAGSGFILGSC